MAITDIVVYVDDSEPSRARIVAAVELARRHDAHLTGLCAISNYLGAIYGEVPISPVFLEALEVETKDAAVRAETVFHSLADKAGVPIEWDCKRGDAADLLIEAARFTDLLVIGQTKQGAFSVAASLQNQVLLGAVRPVLMIPYIGAREMIGERVLVAWNESNESARAVQDALPLLKEAELVEVMVVNPTDADGDIPTAGICRHLARHGVNAEALSANARDLEVGELLLSHIADHNIDLLVMGAYSHTHLRQIIFGGVTRDILQSMTVPVLMSH